MSRQEIIRAWKDAEFRANLSDAQRAMLPANPAGRIELTDSELDRTVATASGLRIKTTLKAGHKSITEN
jgi:mersacidin/lichenicidin family type 2 lantibiotic